MKKMNMCISIAVFSLMASDLSARMVSGGDYFERFAEEGVKRLQEEFKDAEKLAFYLKIFLRESGFRDEVPPQFKRKFNVSDETMRTALMIIIRECTTKVGWTLEGRQQRDGLYPAGDMLSDAIIWLGACTDAETKQFLMGIATDDTKWSSYRMVAFGAYLYSADAQEARDALTRFLIGDMRIDPYLTYLHVITVYDNVEGDTQKRDAIVASLAVILAQEDDKNLFAMVDKRLAQRSKDYAESSQRLAMLNHINRHPPTNHVYTDNDLKTALESFKSLTMLTSVSTNLTELMARDFRKPVEEGEQ